HHKRTPLRPALTVLTLQHFHAPTPPSYLLVPFRTAQYHFVPFPHELVQSGTEQSSSIPPPSSSATGYWLPATGYFCPLRPWRPLREASSRPSASFASYRSSKVIHRR